MKKLMGNLNKKSKYLILFSFFILICLMFLLQLWVEVGKLAYAYPHFDVQKDEYSLQENPPAHWVKLGQVSDLAQWAIIVSEDWAFYEHQGIDFNQLFTVIEESWQQKKFVRGASTITQQVVKNALLNSERTLIRKIKEMIMAVMLERRLSKEQILEHYLNLVELGQGVYGISLAAKTYFQKSPAELNAKEGAFLAMLLPSPIRYAQSFRAQKLTEFAKNQMREILIKMRQAGILTERQRQIQQRKVLSFEVLNYFGEDILDVEKEFLDRQIESEPKPYL